MLSAAPITTARRAQTLTNDAKDDSAYRVSGRPVLSRFRTRESPAIRQRFRSLRASVAAVLLRGNGLSLGSVPRQVNHAELLHEPEFVLSSPVLDDLAVGDPVNGNGHHRQLLSARRNAGQVLDVPPVRGQAGHHPVGFGDLVLDLVPSRRRFPEDLEGLLQALATWRQPGERWGRMVDVPLGDQLIHCLEVPLVDLLIEASDERLVFRNTHCLSLQPQIYLQLPTNGRPAPAVRQG